MPKRVCDVCGKQKNDSGGKTCEKGHFVYYGCRDVGFLDSGITKCPICKTKLK
jgi:hypothetical protein